VGELGTVLTSPDGAEWKETDSGIRNVLANTLYGVAYGPRGYVAVGESGIILTSEDGTDWRPTSSGSPNIFIGITYCADRYIAVGTSQTKERSTKTKINRVFVSPDGEKWAVESIRDAEVFVSAACSSDRRTVLVGKQIAQSDPLPVGK
jgi:hypothetical protein